MRYAIVALCSFGLCLTISAAMFLAVDDCSEMAMRPCVYVWVK